MSEQKLYLYPIWIRLWHLVNALMCLTLIITGLSMQFSGPQVVTRQIRYRCWSIHNIAGIILTVSYLIFFVGNLFMLNGQLLPDGIPRALYPAEKTVHVLYIWHFLKLKNPRSRLPLRANSIHYSNFHMSL